MKKNRGIFSIRHLNANHKFILALIIFVFLGVIFGNLILKHFLCNFLIPYY